MKNILLAAAAATALIASSAANATALFASFGEPGGTTQTIHYQNNGATVGGVISTIGTPLTDFWYNDQTVIPPVLQGHLSAYFVLNATSTSTATCVNNVGIAISCSNPAANFAQNFESGSLSFILPASAGVGAAPGTNLLTIDFENLTMRGRGTAASGLASWDLLIDYGSVLNFSSDFWDFSNLTASDFALNLSAVSPAVSLGANGSINSFSSTMGGSVATDPSPVYVPEPGMIGLFGIGALGLAFARRRRK